MMVMNLVRHLINCVLAFLVLGCEAANQWKVDGISAGDAAFDSTRLRFADRHRDTPLAFELFRTGDELQAYLNLHQFSWDASSKVPVVFHFGDEEKTIELPLLAGGMRLKISSEVTEKIIQTLHEGEKVSIIADGFEMTLEPEYFSRNFDRFLGKRALFQNLIKGPVQ